MEYGLIGEKLGHSYSKLIHEKLADYAYDLVPLSREEFPEFMKSRAFKAVNVTIPYKKEVIPYLDEIDAHAAAIGAVNTIVNKDGRLIGHNTDFSGFEYMTVSSQTEVLGKKALVLGTGGASLAILAVLKKLGAASIISVSRSGKGNAVTYEECLTHHTDAELIVNTTPVGMFPDLSSSPLDLTPFTACRCVLDIIYNPAVTRLAAQARSLGMKGITGLSMLVAQAKYACEFFLERKIDDSVIPEITKELTKGGLI
ncbi:shikimate dehydrogenase [Lacrimispora sp. NSJ-141]|uniref:Shikimate dehydrogenase n=1 Tax=Lientehia hominis TaxID=2897778 RepID=A0AAP2RJZ7_9FIRM|nr:shikimate dehydrogenase [Lientehia hominis]MCD2493041.1 shikimate dehydrogenase [Lientehia hominis]